MFALINSLQISLLGATPDDTSTWHAFPLIIMIINNYKLTVTTLIKYEVQLYGRGAILERIAVALALTR